MENETPSDATDASGAADETSLAGRLLIAMPSMIDPRFHRSVVYVCAHSADGAMGIVVNQELEQIDFAGVVEQLGVETGDREGPLVLQGGPVESSRGFVLHSSDYAQPGTLVIDDKFSLTATVEVLRAITTDEGPEESILALGYAGWAPGQLDREIQENGWLVAPGEPSLVFRAPIADRWSLAMRAIGVDPLALSSVAGHA